MDVYRKRRIVTIALVLIGFCFVIISNSPGQNSHDINNNSSSNQVSALAAEVLSKLQIKGRAPQTGYSRDQFGADWATKNGCDMREITLNRDLMGVKLNDSCQVLSGILNDPYTGKAIQFVRGASTSSTIQIDHVVALSDAWQKGAQSWTKAKRIDFANDPLELLAVDGPANQNKGDGDAATWLPPNKPFRCEYVARQIAVKYKYTLWLTQAEHDAISKILSNCPGQLLPSP